jgi:ribosomal protein L29
LDERDQRILELQQELADLREQHSDSPSVPTAE